MIIEDESFPRLKKTVFPSGEKAGLRSSAGPETTPGANSLGLFEAHTRGTPRLMRATSPRQHLASIIDLFTSFSGFVENARRYRSVPERNLAKEL
jgi:hypothetical protein